MGAAADAVLDDLEPLLRAFPDQAGVLRALVATWMAPVEIIWTAGRDSDTLPGWASLRDPDIAPAEFLEWLGQQAGEYFTPGDDEATRRRQIRETPHMHRGKLSVMVARIRQTLTGNQTVRVLERAGGDQWAVTVITRTAETPDPTATEAAANYRKPAGLIITYITSDAPVWDEATLTWNAAAAKTWDNLTVGDV